MSNNVYFHNSIEASTIYTWLRKNLDIFPAIRYAKLTKSPEKGCAIISLKDEEVDKIKEIIRNTKDYYMAGEESIIIGDTTIRIPAEIVDKI